MTGFARVCSCTHVASNHRITKVQYENEKPVRATQYHNCLVDGCTCAQFVEVNQVDCRLVNYR